MENEDNKSVNMRLYYFQKDLFDSAKKVGRMVELLKDFDNIMVRTEIIEMISTNIKIIHNLCSDQLIDMGEIENDIG